MSRGGLWTVTGSRSVASRSPTSSTSSGDSRAPADQESASRTAQHPRMTTSCAAGQNWPAAGHRQSVRIRSPRAHRGWLFDLRISHQVMPAAAVAQQGRMNIAREIWKPLRAYASQLGARSAVEVSGHLCRICSTALEQSHSVGLGPTALERCLVSALMPEGVPKLASGNLIVIAGLQGWGALAATRKVPSNSKPFEHLSDLADLRKQLKARLNV